MVWGTYMDFYAKALKSCIILIPYLTGFFCSLRWTGMWMCLGQCWAQSKHSVDVSHSVAFPLLLLFPSFVSWAVGSLRAGKISSLSLYFQSPDTVLGLESALTKCVLRKGLASSDLIGPKHLCNHFKCNIIIIHFNGILPEWRAPCCPLCQHSGEWLL